jgi:electron transport complex protein RnfB
MTSSITLVDKIDALLPQTQCRQCGFEGCRPYAQALAENQANLNRCPPGGQKGVQQLARLLQRPELPLDPECGTPEALHLAVIDEDHCIGCTLCIQACPTDAIVGATKQMHTVLSDWCTGCKLCIPPCPVDCIAMVPAGRSWTPDDATAARQRHKARTQRLHRLHPEQHALAARTLSNKAPLTAAAQSDEATRKKAIADALARARARRSRPRQS